MTKTLHFLLLAICTFAGFAQQDTISLEEIHIADNHLRKHSSKHLETLGDSIIVANRPSLHSLLQFNSAIFFKENGPGMVSSPSFRGSSAQQTAVVWNGINVNSTFNGQSDFNSINAAAFDHVSVRAGGGSAIYGTGAIGGSIHLGNTLDFNRHINARFVASAGSFDSDFESAIIRLSNGRLGTSVAISRQYSRNDFDIPGSDRKNLNGGFENLAIAANVGYRLNQNNTFALYQYTFDSERHFSLIFPTDPRTKYRDQQFRMLAEWKYSGHGYTSLLKIANILESYRYFANKDEWDFDFGNSVSRIAKYELSKVFKNSVQLTAVADYTNVEATGSDIGTEQRNTRGVALLFRHSLRRFVYEATARAEDADYYGGAFLYSVGGKYDLGKTLTVRGELSKNYRIPTFNDLFWGEGGNTSLSPETAMQYEAGIDFKQNAVSISATAFLNRISDMIQWLPGETQAWFPQNLNSVTAYGGEVHMDFNRHLGKTSVGAKVIYSYTISKDDRSGNQLIYVPINKLGANACASRGRFSGFLQTLYTGEAFTRTDNNPIYNIDDYFIVNLGIDLKLMRQVQAGIRVNNLLDEKYEVVERRPSPGANYSFNLTLNIN